MSLPLRKARLPLPFQIPSATSQTPPCISGLHHSPGVLGNAGNGGKEAGSSSSWAGGCGAQVPRGQKEVGQEGFRLNKKGKAKGSRRGQERRRGCLKKATEGKAKWEERERGRGWEGKKREAKPRTHQR
jgi:hypothetical protein